jgi:hypothetical protein
MYEIFISTEFLSLLDLVVETLGIFAVSALLIWLFLLVGFDKNKKSKLSINERLKLNYLLSLGLLCVLFSIYIVILYIYNGAHSFNWKEFNLDTDNLYLRLFPQISLFISIVGVFSFNYSKLKTNLKK